MKTNIAFEVTEFQVPNFVRTRLAPNDADDVAIPLSALDSDTLDSLCEAFRREVFKKAGKQQPPIAVEPR